MAETPVLENGRLRLRAADVDRYWEDGFLFPIPALPAEDAEAPRAEFETIETEWHDNGLPLPLNTYKRVNAHCSIPMAAKVAADPRLLDIVEGVLGPDVLIYSVEFFVKEPQTEQVVSMHQDLTVGGLARSTVL